MPGVPPSEKPRVKSAILLILAIGALAMAVVGLWLGLPGKAAKGAPMTSMLQIG